MVDCLSFKQMVPWHGNHLPPDPLTRQLEDVPEEEIHLCASTVLGYSFAVKKWGKLGVDHFSPIVWNTEAFDHLVLSERQKSLIQSLVFVDRSRLITDVVAGKAGGCIIVLHGKPGTGKTLTAEVAAEKAKKPLMVISAAELGTTAKEIEVSLGGILHVCELWDAILLIDEAEVYLEARALGDAQRNAMVSVFLRLLEYHQEVIFLTTNHITRLDAAFKSRIAVAIKYPELDSDARQEIWTRFLKMAKVEILEDILESNAQNTISKAELGILVSKKMNGRYTSSPN